MGVKLPGAGVAKGVTANGEPLTGARTPLLASLVYPEIVLSPTFDTYRWCPSGCTVSDRGKDPAGNGEPLIAESPPVSLLMAYPEMVFEPEFTTYTNRAGRFEQVTDTDVTSAFPTVPAPLVTMQY
jgi:hypothetical protein